MSAWILMRRLLLLSLLLSSLLVQVSGRSKLIDYDALEKSWEAGDAEEELRTEGDEHYRQLSEKTEEEAKTLGPQMIFVTIKAEHQEPLPGIASRWKEMLWNGGVEANIYEVAESKLLVGLQKGVFVDDVMRFLKEQQEVQEFEWNGKPYSTESSATQHGRRHKHRHKRRKSPLRAKAQHGRGRDDDERRHQHTNSLDPQDTNPATFAAEAWHNSGRQQPSLLSSSSNGEST